MTTGVFFGSRSPEHDVSIITAQLVISGLKGLGKKVVPVYLSKKGKWFLGDDLGDLKFFQDKSYEEKLLKYGSYFLDLESSGGKLVFKKKGFLSKEIVIDLAFPAFHGSFGEDGTIQGLFEMLGVPYVGCDVTSSAMTMDKVITKQMYQAEGLPTAKFVFFTKLDWQQKKTESLIMVGNLTWPLFVKPPRLGSSIGIAKVKDEKELEFAIEVAFHYGERVLVEESVEQARDVTCAVLGNLEPQPSLLQESIFGGSHFSYEEKYLTKGGAQFGQDEKSVIIPARLDPSTTRAIQDMAVRVYKLFGCSGIARVDFLYDQVGGRIYANEINTLPGTLYHHLWKASGLELDQLLERLIGLAQERKEREGKISLTFASSILQQARSGKLKFGREEKE